MANLPDSALARYCETALTSWSAAQQAALNGEDVDVADDDWPADPDEGALMHIRDALEPYIVQAYA